MLPNNHKPAKKVVLFKAPALMVVQQTEPNPDAALVLILFKHHNAIPISQDAASLLLDYLRVGKAFFACCRQHKQLYTLLVADIASQLHRSYHGWPLQRPAIVLVIDRAGCITNWQQQFSQIF